MLGFFVLTWLNLEDSAFDVKKGMAGLGAIPKREWTYNTLYSWAYHRHESLQKRLDPDTLKPQCRAVAKASVRSQGF